MCVAVIAGQYCAGIDHYISRPVMRLCRDRSLHILSYELRSSKLDEGVFV